MFNRRALFRVCCLLLPALAAGACAEDVEGEAQYAADMCRRISLVDQALGAPIVGVEDLDLDAANDRLILSAYNRRAVEKAARKKSAAPPQGGIYAVKIDHIANSDGAPVRVASIVAPSDFVGGLRPHGLSFNPATREISFINRAYHLRDGKWRMTPQIEIIGADGEAFVGKAHAAKCSANDVATAGDTTLVSFDHASCNWRAGLEDVFSLKRSGVSKLNGEQVFNDAKFANGLVSFAPDKLALAATREKAVLLMARKDNHELTPIRRVDTPGGPDNLSVSDDGKLIAAVHPSLLRMGLHRRLGVGRAGSRIIEIDPASGETHMLFDDPKGALFQAATSAIEIGDQLIAGSVTDAGLLFCQREG